MSSWYDEVRTSLRDPAQIRPTLARAAAVQPLSELVECLLERPDELERCARWSFVHTLGFEKLVLIAAPPLFMLRLHLWRPGVPNLRHVHNHRADIASAVVRGRLDKRLYRRVGTGIPFIEYREHNFGHAWGLYPVGPAELEVVTSDRIGPGQIYDLPTTALHQVDPHPSDTTVTLFVEMAKTCSTTQVFAPVSEPLPQRTDKSPLDGEALRRRLRLALTDLG
ncbi:MAG TPA: hypothetical protein VFU43_00285 [Streptosporangiaceae bacterium]|nr:hypothetical protein [Streptosporangiaceae bacterium]